MIKKAGPYIGVTGFISRDEVNEALKEVFLSEYRLMVGVLMSSKTLRGEQNKWPHRYPKKDEVGGIFIDSERVLNLIHYSTDQPEGLPEQLKEITTLAGPYLDGFQLNISWPSVDSLKEYFEAYPEKTLILQIGSRALSKIESLEKFKELLTAYRPIISGVLIDESDGTGRLFDSDRASHYLQTASEVQGLGLGVAGGLQTQTLHQLYPLIEKFSGLSIDAEGGLRTPSPEDALSVSCMQDYLREAFLMLDDQDTNLKK